MNYEKKQYRVSVYGVIILFLPINFFSSCSKEDNIDPVITSVNLTLNDTLRNTVTIKVEATDNISTEKLSDINIRQNIKSYSVPSTRRSSYLMMGIGNDADSVNRYYISQGYNALNEDRLDFIYPTEYYSKYYTCVSFCPKNDTDKNYTNFYQCAVPDRFDPLTAKFEIINSKVDNFKANISEDFDIYNNK